MPRHRKCYWVGSQIVVPWPRSSGLGFRMEKRVGYVTADGNVRLADDDSVVPLPSDARLLPS
jgi:hypothetical protein